MRLTNLDALTGKASWTFEYESDYVDRLNYNDGPRSSPVIDEGLVYIFGAGGMLHCVRADDGALVWKVDTAKEFGVVQNFFGVGSSPVVEGDLLIVMAGAARRNIRTSDATTLIGRWETARGSLPSTSGRAR